MQTIFTTIILGCEFKHDPSPQTAYNTFVAAYICFVSAAMTHVEKKNYESIEAC